MQSHPNIAVAVILYHPPEDVVSNIRSYCDYVDKIYVFDNTEGGSELKQQLALLSKTEFFENQENLGIAENLNKAARLAIAENFDWLLTMDQDTAFSEEAIQMYISCFKQYAYKENVALFGTGYAYTNQTIKKECTSLEVDDLITSGSLVNLSLFETIGAFDENLFIDSVDHDYCIRARLNGYAILQFPSIFTAHHLGNEVHKASIKTFFLHKKRKIVHSPLRCYYMFRNMLYLETKYKGSDIPLVKRLRKIVTGNLENSFYYGRQSLKIARYLILAYRHFKKNRMGKLPARY